VETCTVLTTDANALMRPIHDRMPVVIAPEHYLAWMSPETTASTARTLMPAWQAGEWTAHRVSTWVNAPAHDDARCAAEVVA
jgi:putative SOS response-associated peptidase YedK